MKLLLILIILTCIATPCDSKESTDLINISINGFPTSCFINNDKYHDYIFYTSHDGEFLGIIKYNEKIFLYFEDEYKIYVTPTKEIILTTRDIEDKFYINWFTYLLIIIGVIVSIKIIMAVIKR